LADSNKYNEYNPVVHKELITALVNKNNYNEIIFYIVLMDGILHQGLHMILELL